MIMLASRLAPVIGFLALLSGIASGATWTSHTSGTTETLRAVWGTSSTNVWAAGGTTSAHVMLKYNGTSWSTQTLPSGTYRLIGMWGADANNVWASGSNGTIVRTTDGGTNWTLQTTPSGFSTTTLDALWGTSASNIWAVGGTGGILHWDGTSWTSASSPATGRFRGIWGSSASNIFAVTDTPEIVRYNGTSWSSVSQSATAQPLFSVWGIDANNIWAGGNTPTSGQPALIKWSGTSWAAADRTGIPSGTLNNTRGIAGTSANRLWLVNDNAGYIGAWDGTTWSTDNSNSASSIQCLWISPAGDFLVAATASGGLRSLVPPATNTAPTISDVANQSTTTGVATSALAITVGDTETAVASLTLTGSSSNTTLVPNANLVFGGSGASRTVTVTPAAGQTGTATLTLTVTDGGSLTATDTFVLTVSAPAVPGAPTAVTIVDFGSTTARVTFTAPVSDGGAPITSYTVTSSPGGVTATAFAYPITVTGLTNDTAYTFTVTATNSVGTGAASTASSAVTPLPVTRLTLDYGSGPNGSTGQFTSQAIVNGNPAIAYYNTSDTNLMFARNSAADGSGTWTVTTVDFDGNFGQNCSLAVVNGNPAISYRDATNTNLKYVRATDASGTVWGTPVTLDSTGSVGLYTSLAVINGNPAISYYDSTNLDLKYVRATTASGTLATDWGTPVTLDSTGSVGQFTSLAVVNGNPAISYYDVTNADLKYVRATTASGTLATDWGTPVTLDSTGSVGTNTSLAVVNGNPAISYFDVTNLDLKYVRATTASGTLATDWGTPATLDSTGSVGLYTSLVVVNGNPAISYQDGTNFDLKYVRATTASGTLATDWATPTTPDAGVQSGTVGLHTSQAIVNGNPAISYYDFTNSDLKYVRALDASGTVWGTPVTLDSTGSVGFYTSLVVVNGNPAISYQDSGNGDLKYVRATDASGTVWGTPVTLDSTGSVGLYTSLAVINGNPAISYQDGTNADLKYVRATTASGTLATDWGAPVTLDSTGTVGLYTSLAVVNGNPAISYQDGTNADLKYVRATTASGTLATDWATPVTLDSTGSVGLYTSLVVVNGNPAISYSDATNFDLKYVRATTASGTLATDWATPATLDSAGAVGLYTSLVVVNGNPAISYYDGTNGDLKWAVYTAAVAAPTVATISPTSGPTAGGTSVTLTGTNFTGATAVTIGGTAATSVSVTNATTLTCVTPAGTAGTASVLVTTPDGTNSANTLYTYVASDTTGPTVASIVRQTPSAQSLTAGTTTATFRVTFSEAVNTPAAANFAVLAVNSSSIVGTIASVTAISTSIYDVAVSLSSGTGEFRLTVVD